MPYFKNNDVNLLFIHIPKTGGSSLECYFSNKFNIPLNEKSLFMYMNDEKKRQHNVNMESSLQHITYNQMIEYKDILSIDFNNIKIITIVRNPYERIISDLFFLQLITINSSKEETYKCIKNFIASTEYDNHTLPQHYFITIDNELVPNINLLKTETLTSDMIKLGYDDFNFVMLKNNYNLDYYTYLNSDSIQVINEFYHHDFILFNYKKI